MSIEKPNFENKVEKNIDSQEILQEEVSRERWLVSNKPETSRVKKILRSAVLGLAMTGILGSGEENIQAYERGERPVAKSVEKGEELSVEKKIEKVKGGLVKLLKGDDAEKRWLAENVMQQIEAHEELAEKITEKMEGDKLPPPSYLNTIIS